MIGRPTAKISAAPRGAVAPLVDRFLLLTRSCAILDVAAVCTDEVIILCPANHSPPTYVAPIP